MRQIHENYARLVGGLLDCVREIANLAVKEQKKIIIWGFGRGGRFLRHLLQDYCDVKTDYIIDKNWRLSVSADAEPAIYRDSLLEYLDASECILLSTVVNFGEVLEKAQEYHYQQGINLFDMYSKIGDSYVQYLQKQYRNVDFSNVLKEELQLYRENEEYVEHVPFGNSCVDNVFSEILSLTKEVAFYDYGCGKGSMILMAYMYGIKKIGGIEVVEDIYNQAVCNMRELGIACDLFCGDASVFEEIDEYNCFFFYNPFRGQLFERTIQNIENSFRRNKRKVFLIYANPFCHKSVIKGGIFRLYKQIRVDIWDPILNIYMAEDI